MAGSVNRHRAAAIAGNLARVAKEAATPASGGGNAGNLASVAKEVATPASGGGNAGNLARVAEK
ncbi:MAG: hypothetical protein KF760_03030 [Candidatus Eremiobacteraeota bacterium]|nr:hypothetical protein [Candidatus Eremiobacteraeota bacterium]MCW5871818.1 hypothetical protein [Candidatus Eremiobacteraeota bacterium]